MIGLRKDIENKNIYIKMSNCIYIEMELITVCKCCRLVPEKAITHHIKMKKIFENELKELEKEKTEIEEKNITIEKYIEEKEKQNLQIMNIFELFIYRSEEKIREAIKIKIEENSRKIKELQEELKINNLNIIRINVKINNKIEWRKKKQKDNCE